MDVSFDLAWMMGGSWDTAGPSAWCDRFRICTPSGDGCPYLQNWWIEVSVTMHFFWRDAGRHHILLGIPWSIPFIRLACMSQVTNLNSCCVACVLLPLLSVPLINCVLSGGTNCFHTDHIYWSCSYNIASICHLPRPVDPMMARVGWGSKGMVVPMASFLGKP